jgi:outer membrane protein
MSFPSLDSLLNYAEKRSYVIKTGDQQSLLAKWTKITSFFNTVNIKSPFTASWTDNTKLPVSYLPAEAFGGPAGTFKQVTIGQQYVTSYALTPQIDIINPSAWARIKSADLNKQLTRVNNQVSKRNLFESVAAAYYNILSLQYQVKKMEQHLAASDSLVFISENKFKQGIIREQDMNNMKINKLIIQDKLQQLQLQLEQNYNSLKILCDISAESGLQLNQTLESLEMISDQKAAGSSLLIKQSQLQSAYYRSEMNANRWQTFSPTLSLIFNQTWQQNSNSGFFDSNANKFTAQYIGLRLTVPFPLDPARLAQNYTSKINYNISAITALHADLQTKLNNQNLDLDQKRAYSTYSTAKEISELKNSNYQKSLNQYSVGILPADLLLSSFADKVNADLNLISAMAALKFAQTKIQLNNSMQ